MNRDLAARAATQSGLILTADALAAGYDYRAIGRELTTPRWHHVRRVGRGRLPGEGREDRIRALGWTVVRFTWADLFAFAAQISRP